MKRTYTFSFLVCLAVCTALVYSYSAFAQEVDVAEPNAPQASPIVIEDFNYPAGTLLTSTGWNSHSGTGTNQQTVTAPGLTYTSWPGSGIGNAVTLTTSGEDNNKPFVPQSSGVVYAGALVNVSASQVTGDYFFHLFVNATTFYGKVFVRKDASTTNFSFGVSKLANATTGAVYTPATFTINTTYLVVVKYTFNTGSATDDTVDLFVNPVLGGIEPVSTLTATDTGNDAPNFSAIGLRQGTAANAANLIVDAIRVGKAWSDLTSTFRPRNAPADYNGDGITDFAVVRNTTGGSSGQMRWFIQYNGPGGGYQADWGIGSDNFVSGDFDGDGKADIAIWRSGNPPPAPPPNAGFYILKSSDFTAQYLQFGQTGDDPTVVADYTGDGISDPAIYRPGAKSFWWYKASSGPLVGLEVGTQWGQTNDIPAPGDYTGDGKADFAVMRPTNPQSIWFVHPGTGGGDAVGADTAVYFGNGLDIVVPGDYDGDGKADFAVTRNEGNLKVWYYLLNGGTVTTRIQWGLADDLEVQGDYDGDGRTDIAVWRTGTYYLIRSTAGQLAVPFGLSNDTPVLWTYNNHLNNRAFEDLRISKRLSR